MVQLLQKWQAMAKNTAATELLSSPSHGVESGLVLLYSLMLADIKLPAHARACAANMPALKLAASPPPLACPVGCKAAQAACRQIQPALTALGGPVAPCLPTST